MKRANKNKLNCTQYMVITVLSIVCVSSTYLLGSGSNMLGFSVAFVGGAVSILVISNVGESMTKVEVKKEKPEWFKNLKTIE